ncbi:MAG TPA: 30S ribosomal protein S14 [Gammaproteobacteria bacterium]|nr:30S ribosomal protein S14 [Gammaproteobacteria bacterium]
MAKKSMVERQSKRTRIVARYAVRRAELRKILRDPKSDDTARDAARVKLQKMPRDASPVRLRNRCSISGRPQGFYRKFGLGRNKLREATMRGEIPGLSKASW